MARLLHGRVLQRRPRRRRGGHACGVVARQAQIAVRRAPPAGSRPPARRGAGSTGPRRCPTGCGGTPPPAAAPVAEIRVHQRPGHAGSVGHLLEPHRVGSRPRNTSAAAITIVAAASTDLRARRPLGPFGRRPRSPGCRRPVRAGWASTGGRSDPGGRRRRPVDRPRPHSPPRRRRPLHGVAGGASRPPAGSGRRRTGPSATSRICGSSAAQQVLRPGAAGAEPAAARAAPTATAGRPPEPAGRGRDRRGRAPGSTTAARRCTGAPATGVQPVGVRHLADLAEVHDRHPVADVLDHRQVVGDEDRGSGRSAPSCPRAG